MTSVVAPPVGRAVPFDGSLAGESRRAALWLGVFAALGIALTLLYPDSYQQDGGAHYLDARSVWRHPALFVSVWGRPLFTALYSLPALLGYPAAKLFTVAICLATAWHTWRLARELGLERAELAIPFLFLQPHFLLVSVETMTEPLFALVLVIALRLHHRGRVRAGAVAASLLVLARPEGAVVAILWAVLLLVDRRHPWSVGYRLVNVGLLASGLVAWWLAALLITGDPLFIKHDWPGVWDPAQANAGGGFWDYWRGRVEILGPLFQVPFLLGLAMLLARRGLVLITSTFLAFFLLHSALRGLGLPSDGYPRYFVSVAPVMALIALVGWNGLTTLLFPARRGIALAASSAAFAVSGLWSLFRVDDMALSRDAWAVADMYDWYRANPRPARHFIWSQAYMCILFDWDPWDRPNFSDEREANLALFREKPAGTLVFWDGDTGPSWRRITASDIATTGYDVLRSKTYVLSPRFRNRLWFRRGQPRTQQMTLLYKQPNGAPLRDAESEASTARRPAPPASRGP